jgi:23S rRNA pseudouridine1911/1915/1917 synthase
MAVRPEGRPAVTHWQVLERYPATGAPVASLIACRLETGRTHQIRVHLASIGHPLLGDHVYGSGFKTKSALLPPAAREALEALSRQALHAYMLEFEHPVSGEHLAFRSELPPDLGTLRHALTA